MDELASLDQSARETALERFQIIQPCLEQDKSLSVIAKEAGIPYRTVQLRRSLEGPEFNTHAHKGTQGFL
jgi:hypothetical protein